MTARPITQTRLKALLHYDPDTGIFRWIGRKHGRASLKTSAGHIGKRDGYTLIGIQGRLYPAHRLAWLYVHGVYPEGDTDHINRVRHDNRIANLRDVTHAQNCQNNAVRTNSTSGQLGVTWDRLNERWRAKIMVAGKHYCLGRYADLDAAVAARKAAERLHHPYRPS